MAKKKLAKKAAKRAPSRHKAQKPKGPGARKPKGAKAQAKVAETVSAGVDDDEAGTIDGDTIVDAASGDVMRPAEVAGRIGPRENATEDGVVLNTCATIPAAPGEPARPFTLDWTEAECRKLVECRETIRRRQEVVDDYQGKLKEARAALENATEDYFQLFDRVAHATPEVDARTGQRNLFAAPQPGAGAIPGAVAKAPNAALDDDDIRNAIAAACEPSIFTAELVHRGGLAEGEHKILDTAGVKKAADLLILAAKRGVYWWRDLGLEESSARKAAGFALRHIMSDAEVCAQTLATVAGEKYNNLLLTVDEDGQLAAADAINDLGLTDERVLAAMPENARKVYEPAAKLIQECRVIDIGTLLVWTQQAPRFWWVAFPGLGAVAIETIEETLGFAVRAILDEKLAEDADDAPETTNQDDDADQDGED